MFVRGGTHNKQINIYIKQKFKQTTRPTNQPPKTSPPTTTPAPKTNPLPPGKRNAAKNHDDSAEYQQWQCWYHWKFGDKAKHCDCPKN